MWSHTDNNLLGIWINDFTLSNCTMKVVEVHKKPNLCLHALVDIPHGYELRYNYGTPGLWRRGKGMLMCYLVTHKTIKYY